MFKQSVKSQYILLGKGLLFCKERVKYFLVLNAEFWYGRDMRSLNPGGIKIKKYRIRVLCATLPVISKRC